MADDLRAGEDELSDRMRSTFRSLAAEAGPPPRWDTITTAGATGRHAANRFVMAGLALVALVGLVALVVVVRDDSGQRVATGPTTVAGAGDRPLVGTRWWLVSVTEGGGAVALPSTGTPYLGLHFDDGVGGVIAAGSDACNGFTRAATIHTDTIELGDQIGPTTMMACMGGLAEVLQDFYRPGEITFRVTADELELTEASGDVVLSYKAIDTPFGPTDSLIVDHEESDTGAFRLVWDDTGGLDFQATTFASPSDNPGGAGVGADAGRVNAMLVSFEGRPYLFGLIPAETVRLVYEPSGGAPQEVTLHELDDPNFRAVGGFVALESRSWDATAYDADGQEIDRLRWG